jgi:Protein of unknown function (DUF1579)
LSERTRVEIDGEHTPVKDNLLDRLVGKWKVTGMVAGDEVSQSCVVDWVLNHQFLRIHFLDVKKRPPEYEAMVFLGYDNMSERYIIHWLDVFGGRYSETLGYGTKKDESAILFVFEGHTGPLHNTFSWDSKSKTWKMLIRQKNEAGRWALFAEETLQKSS